MTDQTQALATIQTTRERDQLFGDLPVVVQPDHDQDLLWLAWDKAQLAFLESKHRRTGRPHTVNAYRRDIAGFFQWANQHHAYTVPPWQVSPLMAQHWANWMATQGKITQKATATQPAQRAALADSTINRRLAALTSFYDYVRRRYVATTPAGRPLSLWPADRANPFDVVERTPVQPFGRAAFPTTDELKALLASINTTNPTGLRDFALLYTYAHTCRRFSELIQLKWGDIQAMGDNTYSYKFQIMKKGKHTVGHAVLDRNCHAAIITYLKAADRWPLDDDEYIFTPLNPALIQRLRPDAPLQPNRPISNSTANRILKKYARRAGVDPKKCHIHALRHAGLRLRVQEQKKSGKGIDHLEIMNLAQHASLDMTHIYISQVLDDPEDPTGRAAADALLPSQARRAKKKKAEPTQQTLLPNL